MHSIRRQAGGLTARHSPRRLVYVQDSCQLTRQRSSIPGSIVRPARDRSGFRRGLAKARRAIPAGMATMGILLPAVGSGTAAAAAPDSRFRSVTYHGYSFRVPHSWRVINLAHHRRACVRFDRHAVYLGTPSRSQACPSRLLGTTEAMLIEPAAHHAARISIWNAVSRQVIVGTRRIRITATFDTHRSQINRILASAGLPRPVKDPPQVQSAPWLPARVTNYRGRGFDTCT